jgi:hypothetical protein
LGMVTSGSPRLGVVTSGSPGSRVVTSGSPRAARPSAAELLRRY